MPMDLNLTIVWKLVLASLLGGIIGLVRVGTEFVVEFEVDMSHSQEQHLMNRFSTVGGRGELVRHEAAME